MKSDDFERLKAVCEKEGFEICLDAIGCGTYNIWKKDPWEGVEFVEAVINMNNSDLIIGKIYKIVDGPYKEFILDPLSKAGSILRKCYKPSTEEAYVEQLKKEALERFPNIKEGDILKTDWDIDNVKISKGDIGFEYVKYADMLLYNCTLIYKEGKWAERVKERVKVDHVGVDYSTWPGNVFFGFSFKGSQDIDKSGIGSFLASQLEKYLNGEIE